MAIQHMWAITRDCTEDGIDVGVCGPSRCELTFEQIVAHPNGVAFRMLDGDKVVCYEGMYVNVGGGGLGEQAFSPLDDFGAPNAGCTTIQYKAARAAWGDTVGVWETL